MMVVLVCLASPNAAAQDGLGAGFEDLTTLSLEDLMGITVEVTSASKKAQDPFKTPAAVYVLSSEDIRRSGINTLPGLLRLVPGMHAVQADSSTWDISTRGFNSGLSNKLLVLIDGRTVYAPLFGGVFWDVQDTMIEDIDRIEVIRGPGATIWGANAVNGVINIITKRAEDTQGSLIVGYGGNEQEHIVGARHGGTFGEDGYWRAYIRGKENDASRDPFFGHNVGDSWYQRRGGFRADWDSNVTDQVTVQGDVYAGKLRYLTFATDPVNGDFLVHNTSRSNGGNVLGRWTREVSDDESVQVQAYVDRTERENLFYEEDRNTYDIELTHHLQPDDTHDVVWGGGYRQSKANTSNTYQLSIVPRHRKLFIGNVFVQDEITIIPDQLSLTLGTKLEKNAYTGWEHLPSGRVAYTPDSQNTYWGAVSRAVRTPTPIERDGLIPALGLPGFGFTPGTDLVFTFVPSADFQSESLIAYEAGYRFRDEDSFQADVAVYYHDYDHLATLEDGPIFQADANTWQWSLVDDNKMHGFTRGVEFSADWQADSDWDLHGSWTYMEVGFETDNDSTDPFIESTEDNEPRNIFHLRSHHVVDDQWELDWLLFYVDRLTNQGVPSFWRGDVRVGYQPDEQTDFSFGVQNLFHDGEPESNLSNVELNYYLKLVRRF